ncbi:MAG: nucleotidyltransferase domain-containing protein [Chlamydiota bacterium]
MVTKKNIQIDLKIYLKKVKAVIPLEKAYLVGSYANGSANKESDVDLLLLSKSFSKMEMDERLKLLYRKTVGLDFDLHIQAVTPEEYRGASRLIALGVMREGKKILLKT